MDFKELQDIVLDLMEQEDTITRDRVKAFINMAGHDIWNRYAWNERRKVTLLQTEAVVNDGEATATNGSNGIVGVGTTWAGVIDNTWKWAKSNGSPWYGVVLVADNTHLSIDQEYLEETGGPEGYTLYQDVLTMPVDAQSILHITSGDPNRGGVLQALARIDLDALVFLPRQIGVPVQFAMQEKVAEALTFRVWPVPDLTYRIQVTYLNKWVDLVGDTDEPQLQEDKRDLIVLGALKWGYLQAFESGKAQLAGARYESEIKTTWARDKRRTPLTLVMRKFDDWSAWRSPLQLPFSDQI